MTSNFCYRLFITAALFFTCTAESAAQYNLKLKFKNSSVYSGIEVGSKGVKMSLIEMGNNAQQTGAFNALIDTSVNTDFISFTPETFTATAKAFYGLYATAYRKYNLSTDKIFTVVSSGVKIQADKDNKVSWINKLIDTFKIMIGDPARKVDIIDVVQEARLSHLGIVPESKRFTTFLIDIGSGNTKGGYFLNGDTKQLSLFQLSWGTKSIANATDKRIGDDKTVSNFSRQLARVLSGDPDKEIVYAVNVSGAYSMNDNFAFSGGIAWSIATLLYPEMADQPVVPVSYADVVKLNEKILNNYSGLMPDAITAGMKGDDKKQAAAEVIKVNKVFDQRSLLAGTGLLLNIMRQFEGTWEKKQFYLVKNGQTGWISAYVDQRINSIAVH